jgi:phage tail sheath protein FI
MIVEIGMAAVRPAEFIILRFSHKMMEVLTGYSRAIQVRMT